MSLIDSTMIALRRVDVKADAARIANLDTSFHTDRIYHVDITGDSISLTEVSAGFEKRYTIDAQEFARLADYHFAMLAEFGTKTAGAVAAEFTAWNRRAVLQHLYVSPAHRGRGTGRLMVDAVADWARTVGARCLWLETQNTNFGAIQFYRKCGFTLCGADTALYDPRTVDPAEVALYFTLEL